MLGSSVPTETPKYGWSLWPVVIKAGTTCLTIEEGIAKPIPEEDPDDVAIDWVTPITAPLSFSNTPP